MISEITPLGEFWTVQTARAAVIAYAVAIWFRIGMRPRDRSVAKITWSIGWMIFVVHVAVAFDVYHDWSHDDAFERTRQQSGFGQGIYVSYLFTLVWTGDVVWWWFRSASYLSRSSSISVGVHLFMAFIAINGAIIFADGWIRWFGIAAVVLVACKPVLRRTQD